MHFKIRQWLQQNKKETSSMLKNTKLLTIGLMLFSLFFGAGNLIFPPLLGQGAGDQFFTAMLGFAVTGIGLPLLAVIAVGLSDGGLQAIGSRVHPVFGLILSLVVYLSIGPFFGIPRTGTVSFEMGLSFLPDAIREAVWALPVFTIIYFLITLLISLNPSKVIDRVGKILTPVLLTLIVVLFLQSLFHPVGDLGTPTDVYAQFPFFQGFLDGYLTLDALSALVFGGMVVAAIRDDGITDRKKVAATTLKAGLIAVTCLAFVYFSLAYMGATSQQLGMMDNGGEILTAIAFELFGPYGSVLLGVVVLLACLTTSVGLSTSCAQFLNRVFPKLSYKKWLLVVTVFSAFVANVGLTQLIAISVPVLSMIYPAVIVLILLSFLHSFFHGYRAVYAGGIAGALIISVLDTLTGTFGFDFSWLVVFPLYDQGIGWLVPAVIGSLLGYVIGKASEKKAALT